MKTTILKAFLISVLVGGSIGFAVAQEAQSQNELTQEGQLQNNGWSQGLKRKACRDAGFFWYRVGKGNAKQCWKYEKGTTGN